MTVAVDLFPQPRPSPALARLRRLSRPFELLFAALAVLPLLFLAMFAVGGFIPNPYMRIGPEGCYLTFRETIPNTIPITDMPLATRLLGFATLAIIWGALTCALWSLHRLFAGYRRGQVFTEASIGSMRWAGAGLIVFGIGPGATQPFLRAAGSLDHAWFHGHSVVALITGAALLVFAVVFALGQEIAREAEGYV